MRISFTITFLIYDIEKKRKSENTNKTFIRELLNKILNKQ